MTRPVQVPASNSESRKRNEGVRADTLEHVAGLLAAAVEERGSTGLEERDAGYVEGWNAAAAYFAVQFLDAADSIRANS